MLTKGLGHRRLLRDPRVVERAAAAIAREPAADVSGSPALERKSS